jgi:hypothetical protein
VFCTHINTVWVIMTQPLHSPPCILLHITRLLSACLHTGAVTLSHHTCSPPRHQVTGGICNVAMPETAYGTVSQQPLQANLLEGTHDLL